MSEVRSYWDAQFTFVKKGWHSVPDEKKMHSKELKEAKGSSTDFLICLILYYSVCLSSYFIALEAHVSLLAVGQCIHQSVSLLLSCKFSGSK